MKFNKDKERKHLLEAFNSKHLPPSSSSDTALVAAATDHKIDERKRAVELLKKQSSEAKKLGRISKAPLMDGCGIRGGILC